MDFDTYFEKLFNFYNVSTIKELSQKVGIGASTISAWNQRKSISALKKACRELNIYNDIFGNIDNIVINDILLEQAKEKASQYGLNINSYLEFLIVQDLK